MAAHVEELQVYRDLADLYEQRGQVPAAIASSSSRPTRRSLPACPTRPSTCASGCCKPAAITMLKPYASFVEAAEAPDVKLYFARPHLNYPVELACDTLQALRDQEAPPPAPPQRTSEVPPTAPLIDLTGENTAQPLDRAPAPEPGRPHPGPHCARPACPVLAQPRRVPAATSRGRRLRSPTPKASKPEPSAGSWFGLCSSGLSSPPGALGALHPGPAVPACRLATLTPTAGA